MNPFYLDIFKGYTDKNPVMTTLDKAVRIITTDEFHTRRLSRGKGKKSDGEGKRPTYATVDEIATMLCKSIDTIKTYKKRLFAKLEVRSIAEALSYATNYKLI